MCTLLLFYCPTKWREYAEIVYFRVYHVKVLCRQEQLDVSFGERERKSHRDPAGNWTWELPITSPMLLPQSHWSHGRGAKASLHITAMLEASADSSCLSLSLPLSPLDTLPGYKWRSPADGLGWIDCTDTLPERILSLFTTQSPGSITPALTVDNIAEKVNKCPLNRGRYVLFVCNWELEKCLL